ncbi:hypothetical protein ACFORG_20400 [Lutimaribacter marinistellae]|uniref:Ribosome-associated protein n=1 Tax=Lutimaribacter marinistellae TaxID=1820329 RepID=A0ABV7TLQ3_9RHOB
MPTKTRKTTRNQKKEQELFHNLHVLEKGRRRALNDGEREQIIAMLAIQEYHLECTLIMMREYGSEGRSHVEKVARVRETLLSNGVAEVTVRDVQRRLSKKQSKELTRERIAQILSALDRVETSPKLFDEVFSDAGSQQDVRQRKAKFLAKQYDAIRERDRTQEGWRNKKRLQRLLRAYRKQEDSSDRAGDACNVVPLAEGSGSARRKAS